jgi:hypothetical protein
MGRYMKSSLRINKNKNLSLNDIENNKFPFLTETDITSNKINEFRNTVNIVYNSANKELELQKNFDRKRRKIDDIFGINNIPTLNTYDDIIFRKSENLRNERQKRTEKLNNSQKYEALTERQKAMCLIDNEIKRLNTIEKNIYKKLNISMKEIGNN